MPTTSVMPQAQDASTLIFKMERQHPWLRTQTFKIHTVDQFLALLHRIAACKQIDGGLGCKPIGRLTGIGTGTTLNNYGKLRLSISALNDKRKEDGFDVVMIPNDSNLNLDRFCSDRFGVNKTQMIASIKKPDTYLPKEGDDNITKEAVESQITLMRQRYQIYQSHKQLKRKK